MFLQRLDEYAQRLDLPPTLYRQDAVRYVIELAADGRLLTPRPTDTADPDDRAARRGARMLVPRVQRAAGIRPLMLADNAPYTLGLPREGSNEERELACHDAYMAQLEQCAAQTKEPAVQAVLRFLSSEPLEQLELGEDFDRAAYVTFRVDGVYPTALPSVQAFWAAENKDDQAPVMQCLVCGQARPVLKRLKGKLKGIPGGHSTGTALISANESAYESYGLEASLIAPICAPCAERMTKGLNHLLRDQAHHVRLEHSIYVFWTREQTSTGFLALLMSPTAEDVRALLRSAYGPKEYGQVDANRFYAAALSGSGGRAVVRRWIDMAVGDAQANLARWFQRQSIVQAWGEAHRPLSVRQLADATVRVRKDLSPATEEAFVSAALLGLPLPPSLLYQVLLRVRADNGISHAQAAVIKLCLLSRLTITNQNEELETMTELDTTNASPPYLCGRLMAVLEAAQRLAVPGAKATIVDRFYGTASTAPATVFGSLLTQNTAHLSKLRKTRYGAYAGIQRSLEEIMSGLNGFPRTLSFEEQALFALGYYHQRAQDRKQAIDAKNNRLAEEQDQDA